MYNRIVIAFFAVSLALLTNGCYTVSVVEFGNATSTTLRVRSLHTGEQIEVEPKAFKKLPHASGDLIVELPGHATYKFSSVEPPGLDITNAAYLAKRTSLFGPGKIIFRVKLDTNLLLYALLPGKSAIDQTIPQPYGYPKAGETISN